VKLLLRVGANPNLENENGMPLLSSAIENGSPEMVKMLLDAKADPNGGKFDAPLLAAIHAKDINSAELLLQAGANPNGASKMSKSIAGETPQAANWTPLNLAVREKNNEAVQLLLKFKADPNDSQTDGRPLLFSFGVLSDTNILESLLAAGVKVDVMGFGAYPNDNVNLTPLGEAAWRNNAAAVETLLKSGANPNAHFPTHNWTPLHCAAYALADRKVFELLLAYKAERNVRDESGQTPLDILKQKTKADDKTTSAPGQKALAGELCELLRKHGALDKLPDWDRITVSRPSANFSWTVFNMGTNDWNQFTLFDVLGVQYSLLSAYPGGATRVRSFPYGAQGPVGNSLTFPDFSRIVIHRPPASGTNWTELKINLARAFDSGDCAANVSLQFGDVVEIPEADHVINEPWPGLSTNVLFTLKNCLTRHLQITVNGRKTDLTVAPQVELILPWDSGYVRFGVPLRNGGRGGVAPKEELPPEISLIQFEPCMIWPVLENSKLLLASSDLSHVTVKRRDTAAGKMREWTVDCSNSQAPPNFWLRDGDVIEVPEKP